jgi:hypothetical protein
MPWPNLTRTFHIMVLNQNMTIQEGNFFKLSKNLLKKRPASGANIKSLRRYAEGF